MIKVIQMYLKMIKTGLKLLLWPLFTHKYILVNKTVFVPIICCTCTCTLELPPLAKMELLSLSRATSIKKLICFIKFNWRFN